MHPAAKVQFDRVVREFAQWRAVPADERSPAPAWWQPIRSSRTARGDATPVQHTPVRLSAMSRYGSRSEKGSATALRGCA